MQQRKIWLNLNQLISISKYITKEVEKKQKEIEESIGKYNRQRDRLLQWFEKNHDKHNMKKILDLQKVEDKISALEEEWMGL